VSPVVSEGYAYVGDWDFSQMTLTFMPTMCAPLPKEGGNRRVLVPRFKLDVTPTTNRDYANCVSQGPCSAPEGDIADPDSRAWNDPERQDIPVLVSQGQAATYCRWIGGRLPSWAELARAAQGDAALPGVAALTHAAIDCYGRSSGDPMVCAQLDQMNTVQIPHPKLYRVGAVELDRGPDGHRDLFGFAQQTRSYPTSSAFCGQPNGTRDFVTTDPGATQHIVVQFAVGVIHAVKAGGFFFGLLDDSSSIYPVTFRCAYEG